MYLLLWSLLFGSATAFTVQLVVTRDVRGMVQPVDSWGDRCFVTEPPVVDSDGRGKCVGGSERRFNMIKSMREAGAAAAMDVIVLDTGGYMGSSLYHNISAHVMRYTGYDAIGLSYK